MRLQVATSFFKSQGPEIFDMMQWCGLPDTAAARIVDYVVGSEDPFGTKQWKQYFGVDVGFESELSSSFYVFWNGPDPIDSKKKVYETHFPPVLRPRAIAKYKEDTFHPYTIRVLDALATEPLEGTASGFFKQADFTDSLEFIEEKKAGPACWLLLRKGLQAQGKCYEEQKERIKQINGSSGAGYEAGPSAIDLATVYFARCVANQDLPFFGNETWYTGLSCAYSNCEDISTDSDYSYYASESFPLAIGQDPDLGTLRLCTSWKAEDKTGIACLKKF